MKRIEGYHGELIRVSKPDAQGDVCIQVHEGEEETACFYVNAKVLQETFGSAPVVQASDIEEDVEDLLLTALVEKDARLTLELFRDDTTFVASIYRDGDQVAQGRSQNRATAVRLAAKSWANKQVQQAALAALQAVL